ncbi:MAG: 16S rRNA (adenine(1518)-N(6)/adenine(1519)-N(6))-dimethyltransferase RsmA [bacterium]
MQILFSQYLLNKYKIKANKQLGQHFIFSQKIISKIIECFDLKKENVVLEIGAGLGILTQQVSFLANNVIAVEIDKTFLKILNDEFKDYSNIEIIEQNILDLDIVNLFEKYQKKIKVVGNLPYYIANPIIRKMLENRKYISEIIIMVQAEVAERIISSPKTKKYGILSISVQYFAKAEILTKISRENFSPKPKVNSALVKIIPYEKPLFEVKNEDFFFQVIKSAFNKRRKTLLNSLWNSSFLKIDKEKLKEIILQSEIDPLLRAEAITIQKFVTLSNNLFDFKN